MVSRFALLWLIAAVTTIVVALALPAAASQTPGSSPAVDVVRPSVSNIPAFALQIPGKNVTVRTTNGSVHHGVFAVSDVGLVGGTSRNAGVSVPFDQVVTVRKVTHRARYGALIGLAAGVALGALAPDPASCSEPNCQGAGFMAIYGGIGAGIGAALGGAVTAASRDVDVIYDARRSTKSLTIVPIVSPSRKGVAFSIAWR